MDRPFIYVFDADGLTDGLTYNDLMVPLHESSEFLLRRIGGRPEVAQFIQVRSDERRQLFSSPVHIPVEQAIVPELKYRPGSAITFDLGNVLRQGNATTGTPVYYSQLAFQGVRRFPDGRAPQDTAYRYQEKPFAIVTDLAVNWSGRLFPGELVVAGGRQFNVDVRDYDFELHYITMTEFRTGAVGAPTPCNQSIKLMLYDADGNQLMSAPVCDFFLGAGSFNYNSLFPTPPLLYPAGSQILFDIHSLLSDAMAPMALEIAFCGARRLPC